MLSNKKITCPDSLLSIAKKKGPVKTVIVNAGKMVAIESAKQAVEANLIVPLFIGNKTVIEKIAKEIKWDISNYEIIHESIENNTAPIAARLASEGKVKIIVKGHIHTDILMKAVLKRDLNLIGKKRLSHIWHMTLEKNDSPLIITDGALNVLPKLETKMHILKNSVDFAKRIGISKPKVSILSATEEVLDSVPSSVDAREITKKAKDEGIDADVFGPMAFDNSVSRKAAEIKGINNVVAGNTDILLVPNVETGNGLVKMMIFFMSACAAGVVLGGKVPVVITSRADDTQARLASIAAAVIALE
jgi:phosphate acetyltransferase